MEAKQTEQIIAEMNAALRDELLTTIAYSGWRLLKWADTVEPYQFAHLIVLGVAFWSRPDLQALIMLAEKLNGKNAAVLVADIDEFGFTDGFKAFMPGASMPNTTPAIAEYSDGMLISFVEGNAAFKWIKKF